MGGVAYKLALLPSLSVVHHVFHVTMLRQYVPDEFHVIFLDLVELGPNLFLSTSIKSSLIGRSKSVASRRFLQ